MEATILLMDDEEQILILLSKALENEGYKVVTAFDGEDGMHKFQSSKPDLVVTDIRMPCKNGLQVLHEIKQLNSDIDVIILTGHSDEATAIECLRNGAYDYLTKPLEDIEIFFAAINRALYKRRQDLENRKLIKKLEEMSTIDPLTGLYNYHKLQSCMDEEITRSQRYNRQFSVLKVGIDQYKVVKDDFDHPFGDDVLKKMAELCRQNFRKIDQVCRYDKESFFIILPETSKKGALIPTQRLMSTVRKQKFRCDGQKTQTTINFGGASFPDDGTEKIDLISFADQAHYKAKETNRI